MCLLILILSAIAVRAQPPKEAPLGVAWQVRGRWQIEGKGAPVLTGDAIPPGSLLQPTGEPANHSILIFLPDGQRILYECFLAQDCERGFRVPSLYREPDPFAVDMLARIRAVLSRRSPDPESGQSQGPRLAREEALRRSVRETAWKSQDSPRNSPMAAIRMTYDHSIRHPRASPTSYWRKTPRPSHFPCLLPDFTTLRSPTNSTHSASMFSSPPSGPSSQPTS